MNIVDMSPLTLAKQTCPMQSLIYDDVDK